MNRRKLLVACSLTLALCFLPRWCLAAKRTVKATASEFEAERQEQEAVDLFDAIDAGQVEVKFIPKNAKEARVRIKNKSGKPLTVRLPDAFAARPVLAQVAGFNFGQVPGGANGGAQNLGGNFGQNGNPGGRVNFFNVPAEKIADLRVPCVCLEYGKPTPRAAIPYELVRLATVCQEASLPRLLAQLDRGNQSDVQAAAWHIANGMTWEQLAAVRIEHLVESNEPFFTFRELQRAKELVRDVADGEPQPEESQLPAGVAVKLSAAT